MRKIVLAVVIAFAAGITNAMTDVEKRPTATTKPATYSKLPQTQEINSEDVPAIVMNGLNNTYNYEDILKVEVSSFNHTDIYIFTLLLDNGDKKEVHFSTTGVEI